MTHPFICPPRLSSRRRHGPSSPPSCPSILLQVAAATDASGMVRDLATKLTLVHEASLCSDIVRQALRTRHASSPTNANDRARGDCAGCAAVDYFRGVEMPPQVVQHNNR
jgi:hypothetical protein